MLPLFLQYIISVNIEYLENLQTQNVFFASTHTQLICNVYNCSILHNIIYAYLLRKMFLKRVTKVKIWKELVLLKYDSISF